MITNLESNNILFLLPWTLIARYFGQVHDQHQVEHLRREKDRVVRQLEVDLRGSPANMPSQPYPVATDKNVATGPSVMNKQQTSAPYETGFEYTPGAQTPTSSGIPFQPRELAYMVNNVDNMAPNGVYRQCPAPVATTPLVRGQRPGMTYNNMGSTTAYSPYNVSDGGVSTVRSTGIPRSLPKLQEYHGTQSWKSFYTQFVTFARLGGWTDDEKLIHLTVCLRGGALDFYCVQPEAVKQNLHLLIEKLEKRYGLKDLPETLRSEFRSPSMRQKADESLEEWAERVQRVALEAFADLPEHYMNREIITKFCQCLADKEVAQYASDKNPRTIEEAMQTIKTHLYNNKAIFGNRKPIRQITTSDYPEYASNAPNVRSIQENASQSTYWHEDSSGDYEYKAAANLPSMWRGVGSMGYEHPQEQEMAVRRLNHPQRSNARSPGPQNNNKPSLEERFNKLEMMCGQNFDKLFKMFEGDRTMRSQNRPSRSTSPNKNVTCYSCGKLGHYSPDCPDKVRSRSPSPNDKRNKEEQKKVSFALNKETSGV